MDISGVLPGERIVEIKHPGTAEPIGIRVTVCSIDDDRLRDLKRRITDERFKLEARGKTMKAEDIEANAQKLIFTASRGWEWYNPTGKEGDPGYDPDAMPDFKGEVPDFNQRNFYAVITTLPWFSQQLHEAVGETKDFFGNSKRN